VPSPVFSAHAQHTVLLPPGQSLAECLADDSSGAAEDQQLGFEVSRECREEEQGHTDIQGLARHCKAPCTLHQPHCKVGMDKGVATLPIDRVYNALVKDILCATATWWFC
jgi:hypothetical protein